MSDLWLLNQVLNSRSLSSLYQREYTPPNKIRVAEKDYMCDAQYIENANMIVGCGYIVTEKVAYNLYETRKCVIVEEHKRFYLTKDSEGNLETLLKCKIICGDIDFRGWVHEFGSEGRNVYFSTVTDVIRLL